MAPYMNKISAASAFINARVLVSVVQTLPWLFPNFCRQTIMTAREKSGSRPTMHGKKIHTAAMLTEKSATDPLPAED